MKILQVVAPHFVAGIVTDNSTVVETAPIIKYMKGWFTKDVVDYCIKKNWKLEIVN